MCGAGHSRQDFLVTVPLGGVARKLLFAAEATRVQPRTQRAVSSNSMMFFFGTKNRSELVSSPRKEGAFFDMRVLQLEDSTTRAVSRSRMTPSVRRRCSLPPMRGRLRRPCGILCGWAQRKVAFSLSTAATTELASDTPPIFSTSCAVRTQHLRLGKRKKPLAPKPLVATWRQDEVTSPSSVTATVVDGAGKPCGYRLQPSIPKPQERAQTKFRRARATGRCLRQISSVHGRSPGTSWNSLAAPKRDTVRRHACSSTHEHHRREHLRLH